MTDNIQPRTIIYKTIDQVDIPLDLYLPRNALSVPVLLFFHGGGLLQGRRDGLSPHLKHSVDKYGHALISADYRLAPQATISEIVEDVKDCVSFIRSTEGLAKAIGDGIIDAKKLAVCGASAGGYLAFLAGLYCEPKPNVILPIYPITDPLGCFFTQPQPFPLFKPAGQVDTSKKVSEQELLPYLDPGAAAVPNCAAESKRSNFYYYMLEKANLAELLGFNMGSDAYNNFKNDQYRIAKAIAFRGLPPTYVVHGDVDRAVGVEQSDEVVGVMVGLGMSVQYERLKGLDHLFDKSADVHLENMYEFMYKYLSSSKL